MSLRLPPEITDAVVAAADADADHPSRSEMIRRILQDWLTGHGYLKPKLDVVEGGKRRT
jgi:Arc/MetJ-type ribon-helix-helix transcriptional regulator